MPICEYGCGKEGRYELSNKKWCCESVFMKCPAIREKNKKGQKKSHKEGKYKKVYEKISCEFCKQKFSKTVIKRHIDNCYLNPENLKTCPICGTVIYYKDHTTCSRKCAVKYFGIAPKKDNYLHYKTLCFKYHEKKCIICGEDICVSVHHYDENHDNNDPRNLVPLCPTHHMYLNFNDHKYLLKECIDEYVKKFIESFIADVP